MLIKILAPGAKFLVLCVNKKVGPGVEKSFPSPSAALSGSNMTIRSRLWRPFRLSGPDI